MALAPEWAPNLHPLVVHFPIGLLVAAVVVDCLGLIAHGRPAIREIATLLYCTGAALAVIAYFTGRAAADGLVIPSEINWLVNEHADWAFRTTWFFVFFASLRLTVLYILQPKLAAMVGMFVLALVGIGLLSETVERGAGLVFQYGLAVRASAAIEP